MLLMQVKICRNGAWLGQYRAIDQLLWRFVSSVEKQTLQAKGVVAGVAKAVGEWVVKQVQDFWILVRRQDVKVCQACGETKPYSQFYENRLNSDGRHDACHDCCHVRKPSAPSRRHYQRYFTGQYS